MNPSREAPTQEAPSDAPAAVIQARTLRGRPLNRTAERDAQVVRGAMAKQLEELLPGAIEAAVRNAVDEVRRRRIGPAEFPGELALAILHRVQVICFPEEYGVEAYPGVVPPKGPPRAGEERMANYARLVEDVLSCPPRRT